MLYFLVKLFKCRKLVKTSKVQNPVYLRTPILLTLFEKHHERDFVNRNARIQRRADYS